MPDHVFRPSRRAVVAGLAASAALRGAAGADAPFALRCRPDALPLRDKPPPTPVWSLGHQPLSFKRGDRPEIMLANDLAMPVVLTWRGFDGVATAEPLLARAPLAPSATDTFQLALTQAGTYLCDAALLGDGAARPFRALPLIVRDSEPVPVDRDETLLIEGWRVRPDGTAIAPGTDPAGTEAVYTVNGEFSRDIIVRGRERLRLRFINGLPRRVVALKIEHRDVTVMALDGQPAEPFLARNGAFPLAPGGRADVFVDMAADAGSTPILMHDGETARPIARLVASGEPPVRSENLPPPAALPSNNPPTHLDLRAALRVDLPFGGDTKDWIRPAGFAATATPAFRVKAGRTVVLSLTNRAATASVFHLHGHHFRHLDRLDDGWKPFWLDTIAIDAGQTERVAFAAEYPGHWLIEAVETDWKAPRRLRWFSVD
jgi:FtsP/CotA-like multicopper oxidase with cupredoxin domain